VKYLRPQTVNECLKLCGSSRPGSTDGRPVTSHSLRVGGATDVGVNGATEEELEDAGRWKKGSPIPRKVYVRPAKDAQHDPFSKIPVHDPAAVTEE